MDNTRLSLAAEAHLYGYPLVYNLEMMIGHAAGKFPTGAPSIPLGTPRPYWGRMSNLWHLTMTHSTPC